MSILINSELCCGDELCVKICPTSCFSMENNKAVINEFAGQICIDCGHCVSICPKNALTMEIDGEIKSGEKLKSTELPTVSQVKTLIKSRRSIRNYQDKVVPNDLITEALTTMTYSPTAKNKQYLEWCIVQGHEKIQAMAGHVIDFFRPNSALKRLVKAFDNGHDPIFRSAPCLIFAHCDSKEPFGEVDCSIAISQLDLLLQTYGLGTCWAGFGMTAAKHYEPFRLALEIPQEHIAFAGLMVGYSKYKFNAAPPRKNLTHKFIS